MGKGAIPFDVGQLCDNPKHATSATSHGACCMAEKAASSEASPVIEITSLGGAESLFFQPPPHSSERDGGERVEGELSPACKWMTLVIKLDVHH